MARGLYLLLLSFLTAPGLSQGGDFPVPKVLYHYNRYDYLILDSKLNNLPPEIWKKTLEGTSSYPLRIYRRGLYGASHPNYATDYGFKHFALSRNESPWFMGIILNDSCRSGDTYFDIAAADHDPKFIKWLSTSGGSFKEIKTFISQCYGKNETNLDWLVPFSDGNTGPENICTATLAEYFKDHVKVARDGMFPQSWYVRDPSCVEHIKGFPKDEISMMATIPRFWITTPEIGQNADDFAISALTNYVILLKALVEDHEISASNLSALSQSIVRSDIEWVRNSVPEVLKSYERCRSQNKLVEFDNAVSSVHRGVDSIKKQQNNLGVLREDLVKWAGPAAKSFAQICR